MAEEPLKALYFVTRTDGKMIPLLAVDELPHHIVISNVSRIMSAFDIAGMTCVGHADFRYRHHSVESAPELAASNSVQSRDNLKAKYFITRDSGNMVPLVAMDEMPDHFVVDGVPRTVSVFEIAGMTCVGLSDTRDRLHLVEDVNNAPLSYFAERSAAGHAAIRSNASSETTEYGIASPVFNSPPESASEHDSPAAIPAHLVSPKPETRTPISVTTDGFGNITNIVPYPPSRLSSIAPPSEIQSVSGAPTIDTQSETSTAGTGSLATGVKQYCSYWIRHGECDYQQQGCLYKHEMPLDRETLARLGLRDIPRWYREKHALGSYLAAGGSGASFSGEDLKSAAASGTHEDDKQNKMASNWRAGPPPFNRRSNVYNPRSDRSGVQPTWSSRFRSSTPRSPFPGNNNRGNQTTPGQQETGKLPSLANLFIGGHSRRQSTSTVMSDIEAAVFREDTARKVKEDAEYAAVIASDKQKETDDSGKASVKPKSPETNKGRRGPGGNRRGGKRGEGRGRDRKK